MISSIDLLVKALADGAEQRGSMAAAEPARKGAPVHPGLGPIDRWRATWRWRRCMPELGRFFRSGRSRRWSEPMLKDVVAVEIAGPHRLRLTFEDGVSGEVEVARLVAFEGVFAPLADPEQFRAVRVSADAGTVVWPNGADLDPDVLYAEVTGEPVERRLASARAS